MSGPAATGVRRLAGTVTIIETGTVTELMPTVPNAPKASTESMVAAKGLSRTNLNKPLFRSGLCFLTRF